MAMSKTIAGLMGPTLVPLAAALLANIDSISALVEPVSHDTPNRGPNDRARARRRARPQTTMLRRPFPIALSGMAASIAKSTALIAAEAIVLLAIGAFLSYKVYKSS